VTRSGKEYIARLRDGRQVFIDGDPVADVTEHHAFVRSIETIAGLYDLAHDPANRQTMTHRSPATGDPVNTAFLIPRSGADLTRRRQAIEMWARPTLGLMGRSPDHVASFLTAFAAARRVFGRGGNQFADNVVRFYEHVRDEDLYCSYVIVPPQIDRSKPAHQQADPHLYAGVKAATDDGIVIRGAQMLGTGTPLSDYVLLSTIHPMQPGDENYAISVAIPVEAPGLKVLCRRSYATAASSVFDYPLATRFDEMDSFVVFDDVFVPWEHVFVYRDLALTRAQFFETAAHLLGNHQAQVRFSVKLTFLVGLAHRVAEMNGSLAIPAVQGALGELAAHAAMVRALVLAQEGAPVIDEDGVARPNPQALYANMTLQGDIYAAVCHKIRDLCGGGLIQLPSSYRDFGSPEIAGDIDRYMQSPGFPAPERVKLLKLVWDAIGSEFGGRHLQYEMFYAGAPFVVKGHMFRNYDFAEATRLVTEALAGYDLPPLDEDAHAAKQGLGS